MVAVLDLNMFPHILESILAFSTPETLTKLAATNKEIRERVFDKYLPVEHVILHDTLGTLAVHKDNIMEEVHEAVVMRNRSVVQLVDLMGRPFPDDDTVERLFHLLDPAHFRFMPVYRTDLFVTAERATDGSGRYGKWAAMFPFSFTDMLHDFRRISPLDVMEARITGNFKYLLAAPTGARVAVIMLESPKDEGIYDAHDHAIYAALFMNCLAMWLLFSPFDGQLVFVNIEQWLKFSHPDMSLADRRNHWHQEVMRSYLVPGVYAPHATNPNAICTFEGATFMTTEEYKNEVGDAMFELQTRFDEPVLRRL